MKRERGNAMIEFAIAFALLFTALGGAFQFGYSFYLYNKLETAVSSGARYGSLLDYESGSSTPTTAYHNAVVNTVVYGNPAGGTRPVVPSLTTDRVALTVTFDRGVPGTVTVAVRDYTIPAVFGSVHLVSKPKAAYPFLARFAPP